MASWIAPLSLAGLLLSACVPDAREQRIADIQDSADARAHDLQAEAGDEIGKLRAEAQALTVQAENSYGSDAERLQARAAALRDDAQLLERQAQSEAQAIRARARAEMRQVETT